MTRPEVEGFGFFATRHERKDDSLSLPVARLHALECRICPLNCVSASSPKIHPKGAQNAAVYVLGENPGDEEDLTGKHLSGTWGQRLLRELPDDVRKDLRANFIVRDRPPLVGRKGKVPSRRPPSSTEIECCRPSVIRDIEATKPRIILALGNLVINWFGAKGGAVLWGRRYFPARIGSHVAWVVPLQDPGEVSRIDSAGRGEATELEREKARMFPLEVRQALRWADTLPDPVVLGDRDLPKVLVLGRDPEATEVLRRFREESPLLAVDLETHRLRPFATDAKILTVAFSDGKSVVAIPCDHPGGPKLPWQPVVRSVLDAFMPRKGRKPRYLVAHNAAFDFEWLAFILGMQYLRLPIHDTQVQAYTLDERRGGLSLDFVGLQLFGFKIKSATTLDRKNLIRAVLADVLTYNGYDAWITARAFREQMRRLREAELLDAYRFMVLRVPALIHAQIVGVPVDVPTVAKMEQDEHKAISGILTAVRAEPSVKKYEASRGTFNAESPAQLLQLFKDQGVKIGASTDESVLSKMTHPLAKLVLQLRERRKLVGTYISPFLPTTKDSLLFPDGRIHTQYNSTATATGRLSSEDPNLQNFPKREHREVRGILRAPPGWTLLAADYGQIEARVIGILSRDTRFCKALWDRADVHMDWARHLRKAYPPIYRRHLKKADGDEKAAMKALRAEVKNLFVFPAFYLASARSIANYFSVPESDHYVIVELLAKFWRYFHVAKSWQDGLLQFYARHGYVETLTGRRRYGPLGRSMIVNTPVQGLASDFVVDAQSRLLELAWELGKPFICPVLNIHDDLTFLIPTKELPEVRPLILRTMLTFPKWDWVSVPMSVEAEEGTSWDNLQKVGTYYSDELDKIV